MSEATSERQSTNGAVTNSSRIMVPEAPSPAAVRELIARRAYELYKQRGTDCGDELGDWLKAEAELVNMLLPAASSPGAEETKNGSRRSPARTRNAAGGGKAANGAPTRATDSSSRKSSRKRNPS